MATRRWPFQIEDGVPRGRLSAEARLAYECLRMLRTAQVT